MGEIAARLADVVDRHVRQPALGGRRRRSSTRSSAACPRARCTWSALVDRRAAIGRAVALAAPGDVVVIAGKGHEQGQELAGGRKEPFDDVAGRARGAARAPVRHWTDQRIAGAAGAELVRGLDRAAAGPARVVIDSRAIEPGDLFVAIPGERVDGGQFAADALRAGAWGVLAAPAWARRRRGGRGAAPCSPPSIPSPRSARWRGRGGATSPPTSSRSPARSARRRPRT